MTYKNTTRKHPSTTLPSAGRPKNASDQRKTSPQPRVSAARVRAAYRSSCRGITCRCHGRAGRPDCARVGGAQRSRARPSRATGVHASNVASGRSADRVGQKGQGAVVRRANSVADSVGMEAWSRAADGGSSSQRSAAQWRGRIARRLDCHEHASPEDSRPAWGAFAVTRQLPRTYAATPGRWGP